MWNWQSHYYAFAKSLSRKKIIGIVQPTYIPWLPFYERWLNSDVFVILDDVQYSKNNFFNRNSIKTHDGTQLLSIPVLHKNNSLSLINEVLINPSVEWKRKHWRSLKQAYAKAPFWSLFSEKLQALYHSDFGEKLIDWLMPFIQFIAEAFEISTPLVRSSELRIKSTKNQKLIDICKSLEGTHFIVKPGTEDYHPPKEFQKSQIDFSYLSYSKVEYPQLHGDFTPFLSGLDFLLNCGGGRPNFQIA